VSALGILEHDRSAAGFQFTHRSPQENDGFTGMIGRVIHDLFLGVLTGVAIGMAIIVFVTIIDLWSDR
jgi:uncharacterized membrane protein